MKDIGFKQCEKADRLICFCVHKKILSRVTGFYLT